MKRGEDRRGGCPRRSSRNSAELGVAAAWITREDSRVGGLGGRLDRRLSRNDGRLHRGWWCRLRLGGHHRVLPGGFRCVRGRDHRARAWIDVRPRSGAVRRQVGGVVLAHWRRTVRLVRGTDLGRLAATGLGALGRRRLAAQPGLRVQNRARGALFFARRLIHRRSRGHPGAHDHDGLCVRVVAVGTQERAADQLVILREEQPVDVSACCLPPLAERQHLPVLVVGRAQDLGRVLDLDGNVAGTVESAGDFVVAVALSLDRPRHVFTCRLRLT